jgi:hypothetical protein
MGDGQVSDTTLHALIVWYRRMWWYETPSFNQAVNPNTMHTERANTTGSLGAHCRTVNTDFPGSVWAYITDSPYAMDEDGYYRWPLHAALAYMARRSPLMVRFLRRLPAYGYDVEALAWDMGIPEEKTAEYATVAIRTLRTRYIGAPVAIPRRLAPDAGPAFASMVGR